LVSFIGSIINDDDFTNQWMIVEDGKHSLIILSSPESGHYHANH
jgi:hypothetical protein